MVPRSFRKSYIYINKTITHLMKPFKFNLQVNDDFMCSHPCWMSFFNHSNSQYNVDNNELLIRIHHSFLNRSINIIMDWCYNKNPTGSQLVLYIYKNIKLLYSLQRIISSTFNLTVLPPFVSLLIIIKSKDPKSLKFDYEPKHKEEK